MNIFQWLELQRPPVFPLIYPGTAHSLPVSFRQYGAFPQLDIYIRSFRKIPAQRFKIGLFTQQHFKPDMAFYGAPSELPPLYNGELAPETDR